MATDSGTFKTRYAITSRRENSVRAVRTRFHSEAAGSEIDFKPNLIVEDILCHSIFSLCA